MNNTEVFTQFHGMELDDYEPHNQSQSEALVAVDGYMNRIGLAMDKGLGLTLLGPPGVGKTMLASIVMKTAALKWKVRSIEMVSWIDLHHRKFETNRYADDPEIHEEWWRIYQSLEKIRKGYDLLLLDDIGKEYESGSGWSNATFDALLRFRYNHGLATILTSNVNLPEWAPKYSTSLESFLHQSSIVINIDGEDARKSR